MDIARAQEWLEAQQIDGWLLYDFRRSNPLACRFLEIPATQLLTRRFFYWIPRQGSAIKLISSVENPLRHLPGEERRFCSWHELHENLHNLLADCQRVAMEYSPDGAIPEISRVDGGTLELVRRMGCEVVSSGDLLQQFTLWDESKWQAHQRAAAVLDKVVEETWSMLADYLHKMEPITEYDVQQYMLQKIASYGCISDHPPICAVNQHAGDPHYEPKAQGSTVIQKNDWILIDLWCKQNQPGAVYADITRVGVAAAVPTAEQQAIFAIVQKAQAAALQFVEERYAKKQPMYGYEVDRCCRQVIKEAGYGAYFLHRTGHNIDESDHGPGAHLDDLETHDTRQLLPCSCFSIEPGIYLPGFGVRLEYDVFLHPDGRAIVSGGIQKQIHTLLA